MTNSRITRRALGLGAASCLAAPAILRAQGALQKFSVLLSTAPADPAFHVFYFAQEKGFFRDEGLDVEPRPTAGDATAVRVLLSGGADIASVGALPTIQALVGGTRLNIVSCFNPKLDYLLVGSQGLQSAKELDGRAVAVSQVGSTSHLIAQLLIQKAGGDVAKVNWLSVGASSARVQALIAKRVQGAPLNSIFASRAAQMTATTVLGDAARDLPDLVYAWEIVTPQTLAKNRAAVQGFVTATARAARWAVQNADEAAAISRGVLPEQPAPEVTQAIKDFAAKTFWGTTGELSRHQWDFTVSSIRDLGLATNAPNFSDVLIPDFAAAAAQKLGAAPR